jgi:hypothetical protein
MRTIQRQINQVEANESSERRRANEDERLIRKLEQELQRLEARDAALASHNQTLEVTTNKLRDDTAQRLQTIQDRLAKGVTDEEFGSAISRYLGSHKFTWNGAVAGSFIYDHRNSINTFALTF